MYGVSIRMQFGMHDVDDINASIDGLGGAISDFRPFWKEVRSIAAAAFARNFARQGTVEGRWPPLTPKYLKRKLKQGFPPAILVRTMVLKQACTKIGQTAGPHQIIIDEPNLFAFGVTLEYSWLHEKPGGVHGKWRPHLVLDQQGRDEIFAGFNIWTKELVGRHW
ncbi:hypothetical protein ES703_07980 [subsurface metagenome]